MHRLPPLLFLPTVRPLALLLGILLLVGPACGMESMREPDGDGTDGPNGSQSARYVLEPAFTELSFARPVDLQQPPEESDRLFVVEQEGRIHVFSNERSVAETEVFLDITEKVSRDGNEEGLLGLAFHPEYAQNGEFYVYYSASNPRRSVVARYRVDPNDPDRALPGSEEVIMEVEQPAGNHNGGQIGFGPDGYFYVALGDGGAANDQFGNGQDRTTLLATILRVDVDATEDGLAYAIPEDNPFAGNDEGYREEIWAWGLRNPWRFSWDPETGTMWTGDVGQNTYEEIDVVEKGANYGWPIMEGTHCFPPSESQDCDRDGLTEPIVEYGRSDGVSVTGGFVYRGERLPGLQGHYIYADYASGNVWALEQEEGTFVSNRRLMDSDLAIASFGTDRAHHLYALAFDGHIYRFAEAD